MCRQQYVLYHSRYGRPQSPCSTLQCPLSDRLFCAAAVMVTGMVKIYKAYKTKDEKFLGGLNAKNFFGETAIVSTGRNVRRGASIIAATVLSLLD